MKEIKGANDFDLMDGNIFVDFWAAWCGPCKMMSPIFERLSEEYGDKIKFYKNNVDEYIDFAKTFQVMSLPTFIMFKNGKEVFRIVGTKPENAVKEELEKFLQS